MNDIPTMTQKIASEANKQARNTVSNAMRRMASMAAVPGQRARPAAVLMQNPPAGTKRTMQRGRRQFDALWSGKGRTSQPDFDEISHRRKRQQRSSGEPDPQRRVG